MNPPPLANSQSMEFFTPYGTINVPSDSSEQPQVKLGRKSDSPSSEMAQTFKRMYENDKDTVYRHYFVTLTVFLKGKKFTIEEQELVLLEAMKHFKNVYPEDYIFVLELTKKLDLHAHIWLRLRKKHAVSAKKHFEASYGIGRMTFEESKYDDKVYDYLHKDIEETQSYFYEDFRAFYKKTRITNNQGFSKRIKELEKYRSDDSKKLLKKAEFEDEVSKKFIICKQE